MSQLLKVKDLRITFSQRNQCMEVVHGVDFEITGGEKVALVGESGSGKSVTALALARLLPPEPNCSVHGSIEFEGQDVLKMKPRELRKLRGNKIAYIFQEPSACLHPHYSIENQLKEAFRLHRPEVDDIKKEIIKSLDEVGIRDPEKRLKDYPFQLSGGMLQRVMIAMALACRPSLLVADEPTTALDVTIQKQILELIDDLQERHKMSVLLITHNFGVVDGFADRLMVMYKGNMVEEGLTHDVLKHPMHKYTQGLIKCIPRVGEKRHRLHTSAMFSG